MIDKERIEFVFLNSVSSDELFDSFQGALKLRIEDCGLYKIFLSNPTLSTDEIKMFMEKLVREFPDLSFELFLWVAELFENLRNDYERLEDSFQYYKRAFFTDKTNVSPLLKIISLYNYEIDLPVNKKIIDLAENGVVTVHNKSGLYYALSGLYSKTGKEELEIKYYALAERAAERESGKL